MEREGEIPLAPQFKAEIKTPQTLIFLLNRICGL